MGRKSRLKGGERRDQEGKEGEGAIVCFNFTWSMSQRTRMHTPAPDMAILYLPNPFLSKDKSANYVHGTRGTREPVWCGRWGESGTEPF